MPICSRPCPGALRPVIPQVRGKTARLGTEAFENLLVLLERQGARVLPCFFRHRLPDLLDHRPPRLESSLAFGSPPGKTVLHQFGTIAQPCVLPRIERLAQALAEKPTEVNQQDGMVIDSPLLLRMTSIEVGSDPVQLFCHQLQGLTGWIVIPHPALFLGRFVTGFPGPGVSESVLVHLSQP